MDENKLINANKNDNSIKIMIAVICVLVLLIIGLCLYLFVFSKIGSGTDDPDIESALESDLSVPGHDHSGDIVSDTEEYSFAENSVEESYPSSATEPVSEPASATESNTEPVSQDISAPDVSTGPEEEPEHGWVINHLGYTYLYKGFGFEQFTFSDNIFKKYTAALDKVKALTGSKKVYHILVPTHCEFFTIPRSVKEEDDFYCTNQRESMNKVFNAVKDKMINVDVYNTLYEHYDEYLYFNTDPNYTHKAAYYVYLEYCKSANITPVAAGTYQEVVLNEQFLGKFFTATGSERVMNNADRFTYFDIDSVYSATEKVYRGSGVVNRRGVIFADTGTYNYYTFLGEEAKKIEITSTSASSGSILVIGDSSASAFCTFLIPHYQKITFINSGLYKESIADLLSGSEYDAVVLIHYNTTAGRLLYSDLERLTAKGND
ncbi:MAG: hypothetical protein J5760_03480 [Clostridia bacterium]|nr:hypothetical protein [Clostridia bacterium]